MKKLMMIGKVSCGKTTLCQFLNSEQLAYKKTQVLEVKGNLIDTPGEYIERRRYYQALAITGMEVDVILLLISPLDKTFALPPGLQAMFQKPLIGVITKCDLVRHPEQINLARQCLELAGADPIFCISTMTGEGVDDLIGYLEVI